MTDMALKKNAKKSAAKKTTGKESDKHEGAEHESESHHEDGKDGEGADHADADQDKALIKKMVAEFLGDDAKGMSSEEAEAVHQLAHEAMCAHKEMGKDEKESYQHAGEAIKLAHHMSKKEKAAKEAKSKEDADAKAKADAGKKDGKHDDGGAKADADAADGDDDTEESEKESENESDKESENESENHKESTAAEIKSLREQLLLANGKIAALESAGKKTELEKYVDSKLKESGHPTHVTKKFREAAGDMKTKAEFDKAWAVFQEGVGQARQGLDWGILAEKSTSSDFTESDKTKSAKLNFANCADD